MKGRKSMAEINQQKWARMRSILDNLNEMHAMTFEQIHTAVHGVLKTGIGKRTTQNYLAELRALGLVDFDATTRLYELAGNEKQVYATKHDYEIALKHAKHLTLSTSHNQRFDHINPPLTVDLLVFEPERDIDYQCFVQHLRTGYYKDVYSLMEKYKQSMDETGLSMRSGLPKFGFGGSTWNERSHMAGVEQNISEGDFERHMLFEVTPAKGGKLRIQVSPLLSVEEPEYVYVPKVKMQEIIDLRDMLVGRIYSIVNDVINGIPLKGSCNHCPKLKVSIGK